MSDGEFQEKPRHWWIKTVLPAVTAFVVALIGAVSLLYVSRDKGPVATDSQISITEVASSDSLVRTDVKYRVAANDQPVGPVRLLLDLPTTGGPENPRITGIKVSLNAGAKELADSILSVDMVGDLSGIRVKSAKWSPGNAIDVDRPEGVELENALRREGLVVGDLDVNGVAEGSVSLYLEKSSNSLQVNTYVRKHANGQSQLSPKAGGWQLSMQARPGDRVDYLIRAKNNSVDTMWDMVIGDNLPDYVSYIPGSTVIYSMSQPDGLVTRSENLTKGGINIGAYEPKSVAYVQFTVQIDENAKFAKLGDYKLRNVGIARPFASGEVYATSDLVVSVTQD